MPSKELEEYVRENLDKGYYPEEIKESLRSAGYDPSIVDHVISMDHKQEFQKDIPKTNNDPKYPESVVSQSKISKKTFLLISCVIIMVIISTATYFIFMPLDDRVVLKNENAFNAATLNEANSDISMSIKISDYDIGEYEYSKGDHITFLAEVNGKSGEEIVARTNDLMDDEKTIILDENLIQLESVDDEINGNPVIPRLLLTKDLPKGLRIEKFEYSADSRVLGNYKLGEVPCFQHHDLDECYPLDIPVYMEEPVLTKIFKSSGEMHLVIYVYPFQYTVRSGKVVMYDNINLYLKYAPSNFSFDTSFGAIHFDKRAYERDDIATLTVVSQGDAEIVVESEEGDFELTQAAREVNEFKIDISKLNAEYSDYVFYIKGKIDGYVVDETGLGFGIMD